MSISLESSHKEIDLNLLDDILAPYIGKKELLIPVLQKVQSVYGYIPPESISMIAEALGLTPVEVQGVITFYAHFYTSPRGRNVVRVCRGTACHVRGGRGVFRVVRKLIGVDDGETTEDYMFTLETVACLGACALSPVMVINNNYYGQLTPNKIEAIIEQYRHQG